jgi:hypothetical protein
MTTTLAQTTWQTGRCLEIVREGTATTGSATYLTDSSLVEQADFYRGGTVWFASGSNTGKSAVVTDFGEGKITFATQASNCASGDRYAVADPVFPRWQLIQANNMALATTPLLQTDITLVTVANQESYALPAGVFDVRRVEIAQSVTSPYSYARSYYWNEVNGVIYFDTGKKPAVTGYIIRLWYVGYHAELNADADVVNAAVDLEWLRWASVVNVWRWYIKRIEKDSPASTDLLNEAKSNEQAASAKLKKLSLRHMPRDPHYGAW